MPVVRDKYRGSRQYGLAYSAVVAAARGLGGFVGYRWSAEP